MSRRNDHSRRHGHWDPRWYVPTPRPAKEGLRVAFRHELCDTRGNYIGTFVTETEHRQRGDAFTAGDGGALRITGIAAADRSNERPTCTDR